MQGDLTYFRKDAVNYYGVFCDEFDRINPYSDQLTDVRRRYYESNLHTQKDKVRKRIDGEFYRFQYELNEDTSLKWRVYTNSHVVESVVVAGDEKYRVEVRDRSGKILKKCIYFGSYHNWIKTKYYVYGQEDPAVQLALWNANGIEVILKYINGNKEKPEILYPCAVVNDNELLKKITDILGVPSVSSICSKGFVYYANEKISAQWNKFCANPELLDTPTEGSRVQNSQPVPAVKTDEKHVEPPKEMPKQRIDLTQTQDVIVPNVIQHDSVIINSVLNTSNKEEDSFADSVSEDKYENTVPVRSRPFGINQKDGVPAYEDSIEVNNHENEPSQTVDDDNTDDTLLDYSETNDDNNSDKKPKGKLDLFDFLNEDNSDFDDASDNTSNGDFEQSDKQEYIPEFSDFSDSEFENPEKKMNQEEHENHPNTLPIDLDDDDDDDFEGLDLSGSPTQEFRPIRGYEVKKVRRGFDDERRIMSEKERRENIAARAEMKTIEGVKRAYEKAGAKIDVSDRAAEVKFVSEQSKNVVPIDKIIRVSENDLYYYFGSLNDENKRDGRGRTVMKNGFTAYDGGYSSDMRSGFGVYYYRSGKICYVGDWENNRRNGIGVSFNPKNRSMLVADWENDCPVGIGAQFDENGRFTFAGCWESGSREGVGVTYKSDDGGMIVSCWENDVQSEKSTIFDSMGNLIYNGCWKRNAKNGMGTLYDTKGLVIYSGEWKDNKYNGNGTLNLPNGYKIVGEFEMGKIHGYASVTNKKGKKLYEGEWKNSRYDGEGKEYNVRDGSWRQGKFSNGEPVGVLSGYSRDGELLYTGQWQSKKYHGRGISYENGEKVYDGEWIDGVKSGSGKEFENDKCVYAGGFENNMRNGFGTSFNSDGTIEYSGLWTDGYFDGVGLLYDSGEPRYAGSFVMGTLNGRVNEISRDKVIKECIYSEGRCVYMREYTQDGLSLKYEGHVKKGLYEGMGCGFSPDGEKSFEGIFRKNEPFKSMKVSLRRLDKLEYCDEVSRSEYNKYIKGPNYVVEQDYNGGSYTGLLVNGKPEGRGTILYYDHGYTGSFSEGIACGHGTIYQVDGNEISGTFVKLASENTTELTLENGITYHLRSLL